MVIVGHRGASRDAPENTLAAFRLGWRQLADAVELDLRLSADGSLVVHHDADTKRTGGKSLVIAASSLAQLRELDVGRWQGPQWAGERIPTLAEVVEIVPEGRGLMIELKAGPEIVEPLVRELGSCGLTNEQLVVMAFDLETMRRVKQALPNNVCHLVLSSRRSWQWRSWQWRRSSPSEGMFAVARKAGLDGLNLDSRFVIDQALVRRAHSEGLDLHVWTVNDPFRARELKQAGVKGLTTDRPGFLRQALGPEDMATPQGFEP